MDGRRVAICATIAASVTIAALASAAHAQGTDRAIPEWIKTVFGYYANGDIGDAELVNALQYLIDQGILNIDTDHASPPPPPPPTTTAPPPPPAARSAAYAAVDAYASAAYAADNALTTYFMKNFNPFTDGPPGESIALATNVLENIEELSPNVRKTIYSDGTLKKQAESLIDAEAEKSTAYAAADAAEVAADAAEARANTVNTNTARAAAYEALADAAEARAAAHEADAIFFNAFVATLEIINNKLIDVSRDTYTFQIHNIIEATGEATKEGKLFVSASWAAAAAYNEAAAAATSAADAYVAVADYAYVAVADYSDGNTVQVDTGGAELAAKLGAYPESVEFKRLYPEHMVETISILPPHYQYELRSIDEDGSIFETDSLIIEYNADTGESTSTYLCIEPDGDRVSYSGDDLAEVMADVC